MGEGKKSAGRLMVRQLFDILLLQVNCIGIAGALMEVLEIPCGSGQDRFLLWGALFVFCVAAVIFWQKRDKRKGLIYRCAVLLPYVFTVIILRKALFGGTVLALHNAVLNLNTRYGLRIMWPEGLAVLREAGWKAGSEMWMITLSVLVILFPLVLLAAFLLLHADSFWMFLLHGLWFTAACACDRFPDVFFLVFSVLGMVVVLVRKEFEENPGVGMGAVICVVLLSLSGMGLVYHFLLPVVDAEYEERYEDRRRFYEMVNDEWIPGLRNMLSDFGSGPDLAGSFNRQTSSSYAAEELYRVTVDSLPAQSLYLKAYVGGTYGGDGWEARPEGELQEYYEEHGMELPEDLGMLVNISYVAAGGLQENVREGNIRIEELGGKGSMSVYPYGAVLTDDYRVNSDGTVARKGGEYGFTYRPLSDILEARALQEPWKTIEQQYSRYVYDSFLEYPRELELLAERLEQADIRRGSIELRVGDIVNFLESQASYNLDAGANPPGEDFVEYFLFDSHEGYCVHFASAAVLALRYFGIPARYASGYLVVPSDFHRDGNGMFTAVVRGKQAHAWAEIYLAGKGWVPVEATPGMTVSEGGSSMEAVPEREDDVDSWNQNRLEDWDFGGEGSPWPGNAQGPEESPGSGDSPGSGEGKSPKPGEKSPGPGTEDALGTQEGDHMVWEMAARTAPLWIAAILSVSACFLARYLYGRGKRRWLILLENAKERKRILLLYRNMRRALRVAGCCNGLDAEDEDFWQVLRKSLPGMEREEYDSLCAILEKAGFGNAEPSEEEARRVSGIHDRLVKEVYKGLPAYKKPLFAVLVR